MINFVLPYETCKNAYQLLINLDHVDGDIQSKYKWKEKNKDRSSYVSTNSASNKTASTCL